MLTQGNRKVLKLGSPRQISEKKKKIVLKMINIIMVKIIKCSLSRHGGLGQKGWKPCVNKGCKGAFILAALCIMLLRLTDNIRVEVD